MKLNQLPKMHTTKLQPALLTAYLWDRSWIQWNVPMGVAISVYCLLGYDTLCARSQQQAPFQGKPSGCRPLKSVAVVPLQSRTASSNMETNGYFGRMNQPFLLSSLESLTHLLAIEKGKSLILTNAHYLFNTTCHFFFEVWDFLSKL